MLKNKESGQYTITAGRSGVCHDGARRIIYGMVNKVWEEERMFNK